MIIKRRLFSRRRNLTPEEERERELRDRVFRNEYPKLGISHVMSKTFEFRPGIDKDGKPVDGMASYNKFDSPRGLMSKENEIEAIKSQGGKNQREAKKHIQALKRGKSGIISFNPKAPLHMIPHEGGHPAAILNAKNKEEKDIADFDGNLVGAHRDLSLEDSFRAHRELLKGGKKLIDREKLANSEGRKMLERQGATKEELEKYDRGREGELDSYYNGIYDLVKKSEKIVNDKLNERDNSKNIK